MARCGDGFVGIVTLRPVELDAEPEPPSVVQRGDVTGWVVVAGSADEDSFEAFTAGIRTLPVRHTRGRRPRRGTVTTAIWGTEYELRWDGGLFRDGRRLQTDYPRFDTPFVQAARNPSRLHIEHDGHTMDLDWVAGTRIVDGEDDPPPALAGDTATTGRVE